MLKVTIKNNTITKRLVQINRKLKGGTQPLFDSIALDMKKQIIDNFEKGRDPDGKKWKPLKADTLAIPPKMKGKVSIPKSRKILHNTGRLKRSIKHKSTLFSASVGTSVNYAMVHQYGSRHTIRARNAPMLKFYTTNGWRSAKSVTVDIPARPFIGISKRRYKRYYKQIMDFIYK